jgi:hypothetical protein
MSVNKAKDHFSGKGVERLNCGQSILSAFKGKFPLPDQTIKEFEEYGGGKAPGGYCGAYYAGRVLLEKHCPEKMVDFEKTFHTLAGSAKCKEIRASRKLSCLGCIEKAGEYLEKIR